MCNRVIQWGDSVLSIEKHSGGRLLNHRKPASKGSHFFSPGSTVPKPPPRLTDVELLLLRTYWLANLRKRQNFKQVPENRRLKSSITLSCFKCRHQKSYLMDWFWWSYNGFCQCWTDGCNGFLCRLAIGSLSVALGSPWNAPYICLRLLIPALGGPYTKLTSEALKETRERDISNSCRQKNTTPRHVFVIYI